MWSQMTKIYSIYFLRRIFEVSRDQVLLTGVRARETLLRQEALLRARARSFVERCDGTAGAAP